MQSDFARWAQRLVLAVALPLSGCVSYSGYGLKPGEATTADVVASMGEPALRWQEADGRQQFAYPRGPEGTHTFMAYFTADGYLARIESVLEPSYFARILPGRSDTNDVLRLIGPPQAQWTEYFERRDELVWEWRVCDVSGQAARFDVLFDGKSGVVRSTMQRQELRWPEGQSISCSH